jgi:hypothetical protein
MAKQGLRWSSRSTRLSNDCAPATRPAPARITRFMMAFVYPDPMEGTPEGLTGVTRCRGFGPINQNRGQRTLNRGLSRPVMQPWCSRNPISGQANRKVYTSWCHSPGETHLNTLEKP